MSFEKLIAFIQKDIFQFKKSLIFLTILSIIYSTMFNLFIFSQNVGDMESFYEDEAVIMYLLFGVMTIGFTFYFVFSQEFEKKTIRSLAYYDMDYIDFCRYKIFSLIILSMLFFFIIFWIPLLPMILLLASFEAKLEALAIFFGVTFCYIAICYISIFFNNFFKFFGKLKSHNSHMLFAIIFIFSFIFTETMYGEMYNATHDNDDYYDYYEMEYNEPHVVFKFFMYLSPIHVTAKTLDSLCTENSGYDFYLLIISISLIFIFHELYRKKIYFEDMIEK